MKNWMIVVIAGGLLVPAACKKKDDAAKQTPAAAPPAAAKSGVVTLANTKHEQTFEGGYDGTKGIAIRKDAKFTIVLAKDCALACTDLDDFGNYYVVATVKARCPKASTMDLALKDGPDAKPGSHPVSIVLNSFADDSSTAISEVDVKPTVDISETTAEQVTGTIAFKSPAAELTGSFVAPICKPKS